jgi:glycyl-tRNA synthetase
MVLESGETRTLLSLHPCLAPCKVAILPLVKKDGLAEKAGSIYDELRFEFSCFYEEKDAIGKRYRRQDAIGTPFCITVDYETLENDTVTLRYRDSMQQKRVSVAELKDMVMRETSWSTLLHSLDQ